jgi:acetyl-CoA carboxylase carboxyl transferase alpha subunit/acetyl-CoA carboxylase carboxyl transferase beta subunit
MTPRPPESTASWTRCPICRQLNYGKKLHRSLGVCPLCGHHGRLSARERIVQLTDAGTFEDLAAGPVLSDPLGFVDSLPYPQRIEAARRETGEAEAVVCGVAAIAGRRVAMAVMDFRFLGGSLGVGAGELITVIAAHARAHLLPTLLVTASGGARMQEGALSLLQMAKVSQAMAQLQEAGLLTITLVTDPTYGGVAASCATQSDVIIAEPGARLGFAGPRVIRQTIGAELPPGFQTAEFLLAHGAVDHVTPRRRMREIIADLLGAAWPRRDVPGHWTRAPAPRPDDNAGAPAAERTGSWPLVQRARDIARPTTRDYISRICESFLELHGDRIGADSRTVVGGLAAIDGRPVMMIGTQKGHSTAQLMATNFGMAGPDGYRKAVRLFRLAERMRIPVVTLVDTPGAYPGVSAEENGQAHAIAASILCLTSLRVPVVSVITGEGGSGGALALAVADRVLMCENAIYSVISPEGCAAILWDSPAAAPAAADQLRIAAPDLVRLGIVDTIVPEPFGGAQGDPAAAARFLRTRILGALGELHDLTPQTLLNLRRERLRGLGTCQAAEAGPASPAVRSDVAS